MWSFLWNNKPERVKRVVCIRNKDEGGLGMPDIQSIVDTGRIKLLCRIVGGKPEKWKLLPHKYLKCLDEKYNEEYFALRATNTDEIVEKQNIPKLYKECIKAWQKVRKEGSTDEEVNCIMEQFLWCNDKIKIKNTVLEDEKWSQAGIKRVKDIVDYGGRWKTDVAKQKVNDKAAVILKMNKLRNAIPKRWKELIKSSDSEQEPSDYVYDLKGEINKYKGETSRSIYFKLIAMKTEKSAAEVKWEEYFQFEINWRHVYKELNRNDTIRDRQEIDFSWKVIQNAVWTEERLKQKLKVSNGLCVRCQLEVEDMEHLLYTCECNDEVWENVEIWLKKIDENISINFRSIILGIYQNDENANKVEDKKAKRNVVNMVIGIVKWFIWKGRNSVKHEQKWVTNIDIINETKGYLKAKCIIVKKSGKKSIVKVLEKIIQSM